MTVDGDQETQTQARPGVDGRLVFVVAVTAPGPPIPVGGDNEPIRPPRQP